MLACLAPQTAYLVVEDAAVVGVNPPWNQPQVTPLALSRSPTFLPVSSPSALVLVWLLSEQSSNAGGLVRWPVKLLLPVGFTLMALQGVSEIIKRVAALEHLITADFKYEKPLQ